MPKHLKKLISYKTSLKVSSIQSAQSNYLRVMIGRIDGKMRPNRLNSPKSSILFLIGAEEKLRIFPQEI